MPPRAPTPTALPHRLAALGLVLVLLPRLLRGCGATTYTCVIYGNGVPASLKNKLEVDAPALLDKFRGHEGPGYAAVAPGAPASRRDLSAADYETNEALEEEDVEEEENGHRELIDCPNSCSNSGSNYCRSLGCAYCGACNRRHQRDRDLTFSLRGLAGAGAGAGATATATSVEGAMNQDLADYCQGISGCSLWAKIYVVNANGSLSPAT